MPHPQDQIRIWEVERDRLQDLIVEAEGSYPLQGPDRDMIAASIDATRQRIGRIQKLLAEHAHWRNLPPDGVGSGGPP